MGPLPGRHAHSPEAPASDPLPGEPELSPEAPASDPLPGEPELSPEVAVRRHGLRTGFTTGACAAAAAKAAALGLVYGEVPATVSIRLPGGRDVSFPVVEPHCVLGEHARAVVVKDAGDDPDCTHGAHMTAEVRYAPSGKAATELRAGDGVGVVTKPGLGLPVGSPAINPVPRRMILGSVAEVTDLPLVVTLSVPGGQAMAAKTTNERLGIVGGISVLGTTGVVRPFSTAAYRASVVQQIDVAVAQGEPMLVLCTGSRSERAASRLFPELDPVCVVEVGDFSGIALRRAAGAGVNRVVVVAMAGKIAKLAAGIMMTHFHRSAVDTEMLAAVARSCGASETVIEAAGATATARHFFEVCVERGEGAPLHRLCLLARDPCQTHAGGALSCEVVMVDFEGEAVVTRG